MIRKILSTLTLIAFSVSTLITPASARMLTLPVPGTMVAPSAGFNPVVIQGLKVFPENPLQFEFIIDAGDLSEVSGQSSEVSGQWSEVSIKEETQKLVRYFLASLAVPEEEMWVNLSPYEKNRIVPEQFGRTQMGRDLLAQDYLLKQITSSMMHPKGEVGQKLWKRIHAKAKAEYGDVNIPVNTFNKVWIVPQTAEIYTENNVAFITESHLKVMLEEDYVALENHRSDVSRRDGFQTRPDNWNGLKPFPTAPSSQIIREIVIPELEREVNNGQHFAKLRQIYNSMILATWYKYNVQNSVVNQLYSNRRHIAGIESDDPNAKQKIYEMYTQAFQKGAYDTIIEEYDPVAQDTVPTQYFSGGIVPGEAQLTASDTSPVAAMTTRKGFIRAGVNLGDASPAMAKNEDAPDGLGALERINRVTANNSIDSAEELKEKLEAEGVKVREISQIQKFRWKMKVINLREQLPFILSWRLARRYNTSFYLKGYQVEYMDDQEKEQSIIVVVRKSSTLEKLEKAHPDSGLFYPMLLAGAIVLLSESLSGQNAKGSIISYDFRQEEVGFESNADLAMTAGDESAAMINVIPDAYLPQARKEHYAKALSDLKDMNSPNKDKEMQDNISHILLQLIQEVGKNIFKELKSTRIRFSNIYVFIIEESSSHVEHDRGESFNLDLDLLRSLFSRLSEVQSSYEARINEQVETIDILTEGIDIDSAMAGASDQGSVVSDQKEEASAAMVTVVEEEGRQYVTINGHGRYDPLDFLGVVQDILDDLLSRAEGDVVIRRGFGSVRHAVIAMLKDEFNLFENKHLNNVTVSEEDSRKVVNFLNDIEIEIGYQVGDEALEDLEDSAMTAPGGIDLDPAKLKMNMIGEPIQMQMPQNIEFYQNLFNQPLVPQILHMTPVLNLSSVFDEKYFVDEAPLPVDDTADDTTTPELGDLYARYDES